MTDLKDSKDVGKPPGSQHDGKHDEKGADKHVAHDSVSDGEVSDNDKYDKIPSSQAIDKGKGKVTEPPKSDLESGEIEEAPPLPDEELPPLPAQAQAQAPVQQEHDDGWGAFPDGHGGFYFYNRFTNVRQWHNPRVQDEMSAGYYAAYGAPAATGDTTHHIRPAAQGGYNPKIHGNYDPNADYAKYDREPEPNHVAKRGVTAPDAAAYEQSGSFNRFTGKFQTGDQGPERHGDDAKSKRQLQAHFDLDKASNNNDGRSLKKERQARVLTKAEIRAFNAKRKAKKELKKRAWLQD